MIAWDKYIIKELALRKCIIVLGSGISKNSTNNTGKRPMTWLEFLEMASDKLSAVSLRKEVKKLIKANDYLTACEIIKLHLGNNTFNDLMEAL